MSLQEELVALIEKTVREHPANRHPGTDAPIFDAPLVGFASASAPLFARYKDVIGSFYWTPQEALDAGCGPGAARAASVVSWILPIPVVTRKSNRSQDKFPSRQWGHTRFYGEKFNDELRREVVTFLESRGARAVAPSILPGWKVVEDPIVGAASLWSERHTAYAAGLGTFSLNDALITPRGIAHRIGSVVTNAEFAVEAAPLADLRGNCAFYSAKGCGVCIGRCPAGALSEKGHDKALCKAYSYGKVMDEVGERYGVPIAGCGLCQTAVPCESRIPAAARKS